MYNIEELVNILNKKVSLDNFNQGDDKRKANIWTIRMIREFISKHNIKGVKRGKFVLYNDNNIEEIKNIMVLKSVTEMSYKTVSKSNILDINSIYKNDQGKESSYLKNILTDTATIISGSEVNNIELLSRDINLNERSLKVINVNNEISISYSVSNKDLVEKLKQWLNTI